MVQGLSVSPEDYTSLWGWVTFSWVWPLVRRVRVLRVCVWLHVGSKCLLGYRYYAERGRCLGPKSHYAIPVCVCEIQQHKVSMSKLAPFSFAHFPCQTRYATSTTMGGQLFGFDVSQSIPNIVLSYVCQLAVFAYDPLDSLDFVLTLVSVGFNYTSPFFLK